MRFKALVLTGILTAIAIGSCPQVTHAQAVSVTPNAASNGSNVTAAWSGFAGSVNVEVWKGGSFWVYANTNVPGTSSQVLNTSGWEVRGDYRVRITLRSNTSVYAYSNYFSYSTPSASVTPTSVTEGDNTTAQWGGFGGNINLEVWRGNSFWIYANTNISGDGSQTLNTSGWQVRNDYRIRAVLRSNTSVNRFSNYFSVTSPPSMTLTRPTGGETWDVGSTYNIYWNSTNVSGGVLIQPYLNGSPQAPLTTNTPNDGHYSWAIPNNYPTSANFTLGISAMGGSVWDFSGAFTVRPQLPIVLEPSNVAVWTIGESRQVNWTNPGGYSSFRIELSRDAGNSWETLSSSVSGSLNYFTWQVAGNSSSYCRIRITGYFEGGNRVALSPAYFEIADPASSLAVLYPNGGETLQIGEESTITWASQNVSGNIQIDLYRGSTNVLQLAAAASNTGSYPFNPPSSLTPASDYRIGISAESGTLSDFSDANFSIFDPNPSPAGFDYPFGPPDGTPRCAGIAQCSGGWQNVQDFGANTHLGEDWNFGFGDDDLGLPVYAAADGVVGYARDPQAPSWQGVIILHHEGPYDLPGGGTAPVVSSMYAHLDASRIQEWVTEGQTVARGQQIGVIGPTPSESSGPHLHFELRTNDSVVLGNGYDTPQGHIDPSDFIDINRPGSQPYLLLTSPDGGEEWEAGSTHSIEWVASGVTGDIQIQPYRGEQPLTNLAAAAPNTGSWTWAIPEDYEPGDDYRMSISAMGGTVWNFSSSEFLITSSATNSPGQLNQVVFRPARPNPFNPAVALEFVLARDDHIKLEIVDTQGRTVMTPLDVHLPEGVHRHVWSGTDSSGRAAGSGVYFAKLSSSEGVQVRRLVLVR